jgi:hypothetical protein
LHNASLGLHLSRLADTETLKCDMNWFWNTSQSAASSDPLNKLDPSLRDFLEKESPSKQGNDDHKAPTSSHSPRGNSDTRHLHEEAQAPTSNSVAPAVPSQSLYQDGRYAHLWKTYQNYEALENAGKTDADRMADIVSGYKQRKAEIGRAALENCVDFQIGIKECFATGTWTQRAGMCKMENRAFHRCFDMQSRFLKALGYLAVQRSAEDEERIQMHADKLYTEMLDRERKVEEAKARGLEEPNLPPLIQADKTIEALGKDSAWARGREKAQKMGMDELKLSSFTPEKQAEIKARLQGKSKAEQELELQLVVGETRATIDWAERIREQMEEERKNRADRRARGKETFGDTIKRYWGWEQ